MAIFRSFNKIVLVYSLFVHLLIMHFNIQLGTRVNHSSSIKKKNCHCLLFKFCVVRSSLVLLHLTRIPAPFSHLDPSSPSWLPTCSLTAWHRTHLNVHISAPWPVLKTVSWIHCQEPPHRIKYDPQFPHAAWTHPTRLISNTRTASLFPITELVDSPSSPHLNDYEPINPPMLACIFEPTDCSCIEV